MAEMLDNGWIKFKSKEFKTSEIIVLQQRLRSILGSTRILPKDSIAKAYRCLDQLEETTDEYEHPFTIVDGTCHSGLPLAGGLSGPPEE